MSVDMAEFMLCNRGTCRKPATWWVGYGLPYRACDEHYDPKVSERLSQAIKDSNKRVKP